MVAQPAMVALPGEQSFLSEGVCLPAPQPQYNWGWLRYCFPAIFIASDENLQSAITVLVGQSR